MPPKPTESTSRRQDLPLTSREVADSNTHLSKVFGGKQKSWMSQASAESIKSSAALNRNLLAFSSSNASPSDSPLAVISSDVRPSAPRGSGPPRKYPSTVSAQPGLPPTTLPKTPTSTGPLDVNLPSPALTNEPSPAHSNRHVTPQNEAPAFATAANPKSFFSTPGLEDQDPSSWDASAFSLVSSAADNEGTMTHEAAPPSVLSHQAAKPSSAALIPAASETQTQTTKRGRDLKSEDSVEDAAAEHPLKRLRLTGLTECEIASSESYKYVMGSFRENLQKHIDGVGVMSGLVGLELHRYKWLLEACTSMDGFYLIIHQLFCAWTDHTDVVYRLLAPVTATKLNKVFGIMQRLLLCNETLGQKHRTHFANWPRKLEVLDQQKTSVGEVYQTHLLQARQFAEKLADKWDSVMAAVQSRGYPLLAHELMYDFCCWSVVMRKILFTVSRRLLGIKDQTSTQLNSLWDQDQAFELGNLRGGTLEADLEKHRDNLRRLYKTITTDIRRRPQLRGAGSDARSSDPATALNPPPPDSCTTPPSVTPNTLTNLERQYRSTSTTAVTSQSQATSRAATVVPSATGIAFASEREIAEDVVGNTQRVRPRQEQPILTQDSAQGSILQQRNSSRASPATVLNAANSPFGQAPQPQLSTQVPDARPTPALPASMEGSYNSESPRAAVSLNFPSTTRELILPPQRLHPQSHQSHSPAVHPAVRCIAPHEAGIQQRSSGIPPAVNRVAIHQIPTQAQLTQASSPNFTGQQLHQSRTQVPGTHDDSFISEGYSHTQRQFHHAMPIPYMTSNLQSQHSSSSVYQNGSFPARQGMFPAPIAGLNPRQFVTPQHASVSARSRASRPVHNQVRPGNVVSFIPRAIPDNEAPSSPHDWVSAHVAAHLPQLRSPLRKPLPTAIGRHYQYVETFCVPPWRVNPGYGTGVTTFGLSQEVMALHYKKTLDSLGFEVQPYADGARRLRLRCCTLAESTPEQAKATWIETPTKWPSELYVCFNGRNLNIPRKHHFRHDLPLELTDFLVTGSNELRLVLPKRNALAKGELWFAIESVVVCGHDTLLKAVNPMKRPINVSQMELMIAKRLSPGLDEEVQITSDSGLKISITDPWTSVMFEMPVRGVSCQHLECFDLNTYLETRHGKTTPHKPNQEPSLVDCWNCPICGRDARPCTLGVDLYMLRVRNKLVAQGKRNCKAIIAQTDGSWSAVEEPDDDEDDDEESPPGRGQPSRPSVSEPIEVIEILDDD